MGNGWSIAWRVHDAQFWGVPQRRKRIALVADFGGETAPEILFERKSVSRDPSESESQRERTTGDIGSRPDEAISFLERAGCDGGVKEYSSNTNGPEHSQHSTISPSCGCHEEKTFVIEGNGSRPSHQGDGYKESDISYTLNATEHHAVLHGGV